MLMMATAAALVAPLSKGILATAKIAAFQRAKRTRRLLVLWLR